MKLNFMDQSKKKETVSKFNENEIIKVSNFYFCI